MAAEQLYSGGVPASRLRVLVVEENGAARDRVKAALGEHYALSFVYGASQALTSKKPVPDDAGLGITIWPL